ncbi:hypothetical protein B0H14DRAFT_2410012, partial [Mycena olivaceomarginata]
IWVQAHRSLHEQPDIHARLMSRYLQGMVVPLACYIRLRSSSSSRMVVSHSVPADVPSILASERHSLLARAKEAIFRGKNYLP